MYYRLMSQQLPLYDMLANSTSQPTVNDERVCYLINLMEKKHFINIFLLIYHHCMLETEGTGPTLPYGGEKKLSATSITYRFNSLPNKLQRIIKLYVEKALSNK